MTANANGFSTESAAENDGLIAIVGMAGRFPGARTVDEFRQNLLAGTESDRRHRARARAEQYGWDRAVAGFLAAHRIPQPVRGVMA